MSNYCVCIGVDGYAQPAWQLGSCVSDALAFADWAVQFGNVPPANLRLFLSPLGGSLPGQAILPSCKLEVRCDPATRDNILGVILNEIETGGWGKEGDRLYWYFAGHGCSHESVRGKDRPEPVLFPVDVNDLRLGVKNLIAFSDILEPLRGSGPSRQLFFLDACRDFVLDGYTLSGGASSRYIRPPRPNDGKPLRKQYVLYATSPGARSVELGHGVFGSILLRGLSGDPKALLLAAGRTDYQLRFSRLHQFVQAEVSAKVKIALLAHSEQTLQAPQSEADLSDPDFDVQIFPEAEVPPVKVHVRVRPQAALSSARIDALFGEQAVPPPHGPPLGGVNSLLLKPRHYTIKANAPGLGRASKPIEVPFAGIVELNLTAEPAYTGSTFETPYAGLRSAKLCFVSQDENLVVEVWDADNVVRVGLGKVTIQAPRAGRYRAMVLSPDGAPPAQEYSFPECGDVVVLAGNPIIANSQQLRALEQVHIIPEKTRIVLSESLGDLSELKVVSLLGFAAYATYVLRTGPGARLRDLGLLPLADDAENKAWVTVLVAATGYEPAPGLTVRKFLTDATVYIDDSEQPLHKLSVSPRFSTAGQVLTECPEGGFSVELRLPGIPVRRYALSGIRGHISVLVLTIDDTQSIEVQEYLFALGVNDLPPKQLPRLEKVQRFYAAGRPIPQEMLNLLISGEQMNPFQACLAGYLLVRQRQHQRLLGDFNPDSRDWNRNSPLQNMLNFFSMLPDVHVLAGLCRPTHQESHYRAAIDRGIPLFTDGFRTLIDYFGERATSLFPAGMRRAARTVTSGTVFSSWLSWQPVMEFAETGFTPAPTYWRSLEVARDIIERRAAACGKLMIETDDGKHRLLGTGFFVSKSMVLTASHVVEGITKTVAGKRCPSRPLWFVTDNEPSNIQGFAVTQFMSIRPDDRLALLHVDGETHEPIPIVPAETKIARGEEIYLIGYPHIPSQFDAGLLQQVFGKRFGIKRLQPGVILAAPTAERSFDHDASTLPGNGGSPVIDLKTGQAIGVHWGGMDEVGHKRGRATRLAHVSNRTIVQLLRLFK